MIRNYITHHFAENFNKACESAAVPEAIRNSLSSSSRKVLEQFSLSIAASTPEERYRHLFVAILCIRDCNEIVRTHEIRDFEIQARYEVLYRRLEQLCVYVHESLNPALPRELPAA